MSAVRTLSDLEADTLVCQAIGKRPGQSINARALELKERPDNLWSFRVASILLSGKGTPWERVHRAAAVIQAAQRGRGES